MVFFNHATRQMTAKIVYYGPGLCGKTTNLSMIYERTAQKARGEMVSLNTETDRTLFFDLLPMDVGIIGGFKAKLQLYTVPGQVFYNSTRKLVLKGVDGIVFVADSQVPMLDANRESLQNLAENLKELGLNIGEIPMVFQWNKRDLKQIVPLEVLERELNPRLLTSFQAIARGGSGVFETLRGISRLALAQIKRQHLADPGAPQLPVPGLAPAAPAHGAERPGGRAYPGAHPDPARSAPSATRPAPAKAAGTLPEALSFQDLPSPADLFGPGPGEPAGAGQALPENAAGHSGESPLKVLAPLMVKLLPPQQAKPGALANGTPRPLLRPPSPFAQPRVVPAVAKAAHLLTHPGALGGVRPAPLVRLVLPPEAEGGDLEMQVLIRRNGVVVAEAVTSLEGPGPQDPEAITIEIKRF